jgi:hypothetical protein
MTTLTLGRNTSDGKVTCIACGETVNREEAREYDKYGDRWSRDGKDFEYLCKPCHREYCHQNRRGLEEMLVTAEAGRTDRKTFLKQLCESMMDTNDPNEKSKQ